MRICQVGGNVTSSGGGTARAVLDIQSCMGGDIVSFTPSLEEAAEGGSLLHVHTGATLAGRQYRYVPAAGLRAAREMLGRADVVLVHNIYKYHFDWALRASKQAGIPCVVLPHGSLDPYVFSYRSWRKRLWLSLGGREAIKQAGLVLFATDMERDKALQCVIPRRHTVIPFMVDLPAASPAALAQQRQQARLARGYAVDDIVLVFLGRISQEKRPFEIIRAFAQASPQAPKLRLLMVGPDGERLQRSECERYAAQMGVRNIRFEGGVYGADKEALLAGADVLVNFSFKENFGYAMCEGLSYGVPCIASRGNDLGATLFEAGAIWMPAGDADADLALTMLEIAAMPQAQRQAMGARGREWVRSKLSADAFKQRLGAALEAIPKPRR